MRRKAQDQLSLFEPVAEDAPKPARFESKGEFGDAFDYLFGPTIAHGRGSGWPFPERLRPRLFEERMLLVASGEKNKATLAEALGYLSCASMDAPLPSEYVEIMCWLSQEVMPRYGYEGEIWRDLGYSKPIELSQWHTTLLDQLRCDIRAAVVKNAKLTQKARHRL